MNGTLVGMVRGFSPWIFIKAIFVIDIGHLEPSVLVQVDLKPLGSAEPPSPDYNNSVGVPDFVTSFELSPSVEVLEVEQMWVLLPWLALYP